MECKTRLSGPIREADGSRPSLQSRCKQQRRDPKAAPLTALPERRVTLHSGDMGDTCPRRRGHALEGVSRRGRASPVHCPPARRDSRLRDWPDVEWRMMRRDDDPASARFSQPTAATWTFLRVSLSTTSDAAHHDRGRLTTGCGWPRCPGCRARCPAGGWRATLGPVDQVGARGQRHTRAAIETALRLGVKNEALTRKPGPRNSQLYALGVPVSRSVPSVSRDSSVQCPTALIERDTRTLPKGSHNLNGSGHSPAFNPTLACVLPGRGNQ